MIFDNIGPPIQTSDREESQTTFLLTGENIWARQPGFGDAHWHWVQQRDPDTSLSPRGKKYGQRQTGHNDGTMKTVFSGCRDVTESPVFSS